MITLSPVMYSRTGKYGDAPDSTGAQGGGVNIGSFTVDANKVYEVSILEGLLTSQSWAVS